MARWAIVPTRQPNLQLRAAAHRQIGRNSPSSEANQIRGDGKVRAEPPPHSRKPHISKTGTEAPPACGLEAGGLDIAAALQRAFSNGSDFASIATDASGIIRIFNGGAERMLGYTAAEVVNQRSPFEFHDTQESIERAAALSLAFGTEVAPGFDALIFKASRGIEDTCELTTIRKDGSRLPVVVSVTPLRDARREIIGYLLISTDITGRKPAQDKFRSLFEAVPDALVVVNRNGEIVLVNSQTERAFGYARSELLGKKVESLVPERFRERHGEHRSGYFSDPQVRPAGTDRSLWALRKDGSEFPVEISLSSIDTEDGRLVSAAIREVTDRKQAYEYARSLLEASLDPLVTISAEGKITDVNEGSVKVTGVARESLIGTDFSSYFTEPEKAREGYQQVFAEGLVTDYPLTIRHKDGRLTDVLYNASVYKDVSGKVLGVFAAARDITDRKQASEYARSLLEASLDPLVTISPDGKITDVNEGSIKVTGVAREQLIGTDFSDYFTEPDKARKGYQQVFAKGSVIDYPLTIRHQSGRLTDVLYTASVYKDARGKVLGVFAAARDITDRKQASEYARSLLEASLDPLVTISPDGKITDVNEGSIKATGVAREKLIGTDFSDYFTEPDKAREGYLQVFAKGSVIDYPLTIRHRSGRLTDVLYNASIYKDARGKVLGVFAAARDITDRKLAEAALLKAGALQSAIFNSANFSSIATDAKGVIQIFNVGAERMLGYTAADVMNKITPADISDPHELIARATALSAELGTAITPGFEALVFKASRGIEDIYELTYIRKDGSRFPAVVSVTALRDAQDAIIGYLLIGTDNTARKQVDAERQRLDRVLRATNLELQSAKTEAERANLAKSDFLSSMSHELRSPLNAILGFAQLMDSGLPLPTPGQKDSIDQILQAGWYLLELINEILDLALVESGKLSLSPEPVSLEEVLSDCRAMIEPQARKRGFEVSFAKPESPLFVLVDRTRVKQIFVNLLSNAVKYNRVGGSVVVSCHPVAGGLVRVSVQDTGEGLAQDKLIQLFQPFNRLGQEAGLEEGTGIGLVVSKQLVELMGGSIGVQSTVGVGSVFWIELQATDAIEVQRALSPPVADTSAEAEAKAVLRTVLCVEDNPANLKLISKLLERRPDLRLLSAGDGRQGVEIAHAVRPDVILMDINLPGISGVAALKLLASSPATEHIPVIAISANAMPRDIERGLEAGFFRYLTKPIKVGEFLETLDLALECANARSGGSGLEAAIE